MDVGPSKGNSDCPWADRAISVEKVATANLPTERGDFKISGYRSLTSDEEFVVLHMGEMDPEVPTLVRIHSQCLTGDVFGSVKCDCGRQLRAAMRLIADEGCGVIVYQQQEGRGIGIINKIRAYAQAMRLVALAESQFGELPTPSRIAFAASVNLTIGGAWGMCEPSPGMSAAYEQHPELASMRLDYRQAVRELVATTIVGLLARPAAVG